MQWQQFLSDLGRVADETLFAVESEDAPILVTGPAESAGITADAIWFLGVDDNAWPARGERHPLLPLEVQRSVNMPHATPQADWDLAQATTARLLTSAPEIIFSFAHLSEGVEARGSRLVTQLAGDPQPLPQELLPTRTPVSPCLTCDDIAAIPHPRPTDGDAMHLRGGAALLTAQSQCAFKAFANGRLGTRDCDAAEDALTPSERGELLHAVLHSAWGGPPNGIRSRTDLLNLHDLESFVAQHVEAAMLDKQLARVREDMPARYLELEGIRLTRLVLEWLSYERTRVDFEVVETEAKTTLTLAGVSLDLRLDRLDRLTDGSFLVIDYKTGNVSPKSWELPRPEDVQLPLYAGFGLAEGQIAAGLVFAEVSAGKMCFAGRVVDARATVDSSLKSPSALVKYPMGAEDLMDWREAIEKLATDFINGRADVDPLDAVRTCERCGLQTLCRIKERNPISEESEDEGNADE
jgi:probable DNA repair protein